MLRPLRVGRAARAVAARATRRAVGSTVRHKVVTLEDAVAVVHSGDTVACSGFVAQGAPEALLEALGKRFVETGEPNNLTVFFGGGPGDWATRGLNHLGKEAHQGPPGTKLNMVSRTIGAHYGQVPALAKLALENKVQAYSIPLGSVSRMWRAQGAHLPGHITTIGLGTFVDPELTGGKINERARREGIDVVESIMVAGQRHLFYKALPINVAFIRATTADPDGNLTLEHESLLADQRILAMAARNSGGVVVAQVKRLAATGSQPARMVRVPGVLVDCVVVVPEEEQEAKHAMSYFTRHNPAWSHELRMPMDTVQPLVLSERKVIARRAAMALKPNQVVNLGIGMPEGVSAVAAEENVLPHVTLTTEAGAIGGLGASGHNFGPAANAYSIQEMNAQFDFYNGGGLDVCFLGMAETTANGNVNVSRLEEKRLTGPGGFIDITQSTRKVVFMGSFTAKGAKLEFVPDPANPRHRGALRIAAEGAVRKFVARTREVTFSGDEAVRRGQKVLYVTERAVFQRTAAHPVIELIEIAPGIDLHRDVLSHMDFAPVVSPELKTMDPRIFGLEPMGLREDFFGRTVQDRCIYHEADHALYVDLTGITLATVADVDQVVGGIEGVMKPLVAKGGPLNVVVNYDNFDLRVEVEKLYQDRVKELQAKYYKTVRRYTGSAFRRQRLSKNLSMLSWGADDMFREFDTNGDGVVSPAELREGVRKHYSLSLTERDVARFFKGQQKGIDRETFLATLNALLCEGGGRGGGLGCP